MPVHRDAAMTSVHNDQPDAHTQPVQPSVDLFPPSVTRRLTVRHHTHYAYEPEVRLSHAVVMLRPTVFPCQHINSASLSVDPSPDALVDSADPFGNVSTWVSVERPHGSLSFESMLDITVTEPAYDAALGRPFAEAVVAAANSTDPLVRWLRLPSAAVPLMDAASLGSVQINAQGTLGEALWHLLDVFGDEFTFDPSSTVVSTPVSDVLRLRRGVCQDFAHAALVALRSAGLSARYMSGYVETTPTPGEPRLVGADASHAWVAVWSGNSWLEIDPTNRCFATYSHVRIAAGRDYYDVAPVRGVTIGVPHTETLTTSVDTVAFEA